MSISGVEVASRLIQQQYLGLIGQGSRDCHPLLLPTRKLVRIVL